jgi:hypothetical protein
MKTFNVGEPIKFRTIFFNEIGEGIFIQFADDFHYQIEVIKGNGKYRAGQKIWLREWEIVDN